MWEKTKVGGRARRKRRKKFDKSSEERSVRRQGTSLLLYRFAQALQTAQKRQSGLHWRMGTKRYIDRCEEAGRNR